MRRAALQQNKIYAVSSHECCGVGLSALDAYVRACWPSIEGGITGDLETILTSCSPPIQPEPVNDLRCLRQLHSVIGCVQKADAHLMTIRMQSCWKHRRGTMPEATLSRPQVNGILETSLYVERPTRSVEFYRRVFGFESIDADPQESITDQTRLCALRAGDRSVLLLFRKGATADTDPMGAIHVAFGISRSELPAWEAWLSQQGIAIELRKTWKYGGEALYFRDPDGHLLEVVTPGVWSIF